MSKSQGSTHVHCYPIILCDADQLMVVAAGLPCSTVKQPVYLDATAKLSHNFGAVTYEEVEESLHRYVSSIIASHSKQADSRLVDILTRCLVSLYEQRLKPALWVQVIDSIIVIWCDIQFDGDERADENEISDDDERADENEISIANYGWLVIVCDEITSIITDSTNPTDTATVHGTLIVDPDSCHRIYEDDEIPRAVKRVLKDDNYDFPAEPTATLAD